LKGILFKYFALFLESQGWQVLNSGISNKSLMGSSIAVSSGKGGVGKTNVTVNLGVALAGLGKNVAIIDASLTTPDVSLQMGIPFRVKSLSHILKENSNINDATYTHKSGAKVIPGNIHLNVLKEFEGNRFSKLLKSLKKENDFVLVDCAAGLGREAVSSIKNCDKMLIVANPELASVVNSSKAIQLARDLNTEAIGIVLNMVGKHRHELKEKDIVPFLGDIPVIGRIPEDEKVSASIKKSVPVINYSPNSGASSEFRNIALILSGEKPKRIKKTKKQKVKKKASSEDEVGLKRELSIGKTIPKQLPRKNIIESLTGIYSR
jgi:septum site-determining protein MinD